MRWKFIFSRRAAIREKLSDPTISAPGSLMTNATVGQVSDTGNGKTLTVTQKGSNSVIEIGPDVPVVMAVPGDRSLLKPGAAVFIAAVKKDDGSLVANRITAEKDGVKPPM